MADLRPNTELVAVKWLGTLTGLAPGMVATTLPANNESWATSGFVQVGPSVGGSIEPYTGLRHPVVSLHTWAVNLNSDNPPWGKAAGLLEYIIAACISGDGMQTAITPRTGYSQVAVQSAVPKGDPRRILGDPAAYAHYQLDLELNWVSLA